MSETAEAAAWLRAQAEADIVAAEEAGLSSPAPWAATGEDIVSATDDPFYRGICAANANGAEAEHIVRHDPLTEAARAESVLAVLDLYEQTVAAVERSPLPGSLCGGLQPRQAGVSARDYLDARRGLAALGPVVRLLAAGYRRREGWKESWA